MFKPSINFLADRSKAVLLLWIFFIVNFVVVCHTVLSVTYSLVVTSCEGVDLSALLYLVFLEFVSFSHTVSWVRCVTSLYRFLSFVFSLICNNISGLVKTQQFNKM